uniref:F-box associated domain-containing protein n=1 Tax=Oryza barthii TaxID=65489 RepID=A0A0D3H5K8_9ORYZ
MSSYRVTCMVYVEYNGVCDGTGTVRACVFDQNGRNRWKRRPARWYMAKCGVHLRGSDYVRFLGHAIDTMFWGIEGDNVLLILHEWSTEFEILCLPYCIRAPTMIAPYFTIAGALRGVELQAVVDGNGNNKGKLCVICLDQENVLRVFTTWRDRYVNGEWGEWVLQNSLRLAAITTGLSGYKEGYFRSNTAKVVTVKVGSVVLTPAEETTWMFSVDLETMEVAKCKDVSMAFYPCQLPWLPTLRACVNHCKRRGQGCCSHICICGNG